MAASADGDGAADMLPLKAHNSGGTPLLPLASCLLLGGLGWFTAVRCDSGVGFLTGLHLILRRLAFCVLIPRCGLAEVLTCCRVPGVRGSKVNPRRSAQKLVAQNQIIVLKIY
ncbi:hypothetical protein E2C01_035646 [Portunus trituberculatus]|uniref:Uncharacterized protein n=1 Tax=Portunus trituberculatus TaxID=210409 RepID=A0A5B7FAB4_PORTR|nr:hypothetical protein [Portunus trituberculatus]